MSNKNTNAEKSADIDILPINKISLSGETDVSVEAQNDGRTQNIYECPAEERTITSSLASTNEQPPQNPEAAFSSTRPFVNGDSARGPSRSPPLNDTHRSFPRDFDSPLRKQPRRNNPEDAGGSALLSRTSESESQNVPKTQIEMPKKHEESTLIYSKQDLGTILRKIHEKTGYENKMLLLELQSLEQKYEAILSANADVSLKLYEQSVSEEEVKELLTERNTNQTIVESIIYEKQNLHVEFSSIQSSFHDLRLRFDEQKRAEEQLRLNEKEYQDRIKAIKRKTETKEAHIKALKEHAEEKIKEANSELEKKNMGASADHLLLQEQLQQIEKTAAALEKTLKAKEAENKELYLIWDELSKQIETKEQPLKV
eukprot:GHVN01009719.1.p1 GENE.GHVN01009719.1~~GHVN01009719.1.p1  ORF type:complete len:371 (-),score=50.53 GHVN01009719.1:64-1176(-)